MKKYLWVRHALALAVLALSSTAGSAQEACTLTVMPATEFGADVALGRSSAWETGDVQIFAPASKVSSRRMREILQTIFTPAVQVEAVKGLDLPNLLGWPGADVTVALSGTGPRPSVRCSAELRLRKIAYMQVPLYGNAMRLPFEMTYAAPGTPPRKVSGEVRQKLRDVYGRAEDLTKATAGLTQAYQKGVVEIIEEKIRKLPSRD